MSTQLLELIIRFDTRLVVPRVHRGTLVNGDEVNALLFHEVRSHFPRAVLKDLIYPSAVPNELKSLDVRPSGLCVVLMQEVV